MKAYLSTSDPSEHFVEPVKYRSFPGYLRSPFIAHVKKTNAPEDFPGLCFLSIDKTLPFRIIYKFQVDRQKRISRGLVHCAMCGVEKFFDGSFVWMETTHHIALIGHCCADKENVEIAANDYTSRTVIRQNEDFLLQALTEIGSMRKKITEAIAIAEVSSSARRKFCSEFPNLTELLVYADRGGGLLTYIEDITEEFAGVGPKGIRSRGSKHFTRAHSVGVLAGGKCLRGAYKPTRFLRFALTKLSVLPDCQTEDEAFSYVSALSPEFAAEAVAYIRAAKSDYVKGCAELQLAAAFFSLDNQQRISTWQQRSRVGEVYYEARPQGSAVSLTWRERGAFGHMVAPSDVFKPTFPWAVSDEQVNE